MSNRVDILELPFDLVTHQDVFDAVASWRAAAQHHYIVLANPHTVLSCRRDAHFRSAATRAALVLPDGVGITLAARLLGLSGYKRIAGPSLMLDACDRGRRLDWRHYFYGGRTGVADELARRLSCSYPGLIVAGSCAPPFRALSSDEDEHFVRSINAARPDIVWVGLGTGKQEKWMMSHLGRIRAAALIGVGAAFDFHSGNAAWAPAWVREAGLEWAYRILHEPRRLWRRNLDSPVFLSAVLLQRLQMTATSLLGARP